MILQEEIVVKRKNKMPFLDPEELKPKLREVFETVVIPQIIKAKMKQTAVEWLVEHLNLDETSPNYNQWVVEQAKAMEEEQIGYSEIDLEVAFFEGSIHNLTFNQWLEQFKNQKNNL